MHRAFLSDSVDTTGALFEAHRIPGQLQIDDDSAVLMEVQSFAGGIGRQEKPPAAGREVTNRRSSFFPRKSTMKGRTRLLEAVADVKQRVAILRENNCLFSAFLQTLDQTREQSQLAVVPHRDPSSGRDGLEKLPLSRNVIQSLARPDWCGVTAVRLAVVVIEREPGLVLVLHGENQQATLDRTLK